MLITFSCDAHESIIMFGNVGLLLLGMMGYPGKESGIIHAEEINLVRTHLRSALDHNKSLYPAETDENEESNTPRDHEPKVSLEHRAFPLFELFDAAEKEKCDVKWTSSK